MRRRKQSASGFTLVEVMVSITVLSLILLATVTSLRTFGNTQSSLQRMTHRVDEVRSVSGFLRRALEATVVGDGNSGLSLGVGGSGSGGSDFAGNTEHFQWRSVLVFGESYGGSFLLRVAKEDDRLMLRWLDQEVARNREPDWSSAEGWPLVEGLQDFSVAYRANPRSEWQPLWDDDGESPQWVRMTIRSKNRFWPELIMQVPQ